MALRKWTALTVAFLVPTVVSQSEPWPSTLFREPSEFFVNSFGDCMYQLSFLRDRNDYALTYFFEAQYANSPPRMIPYMRPYPTNPYWVPTNGPGVGWMDGAGLSPASNKGLYRVNEDSVRPYYFFPAACSNGSAEGYEGERPTSFRVIVDAPWTSDPIPVQDVARPDDVPFYDIEAASLEDGSVQFTWPQAAGASRYLIVVEGWFFNDRDRNQYRTYINEGADNTTLIVPSEIRCRQGAILPEGEPGVYARGASSSDIIGF